MLGWTFETWTCIDNKVYYAAMEVLKGESDFEKALIRDKIWIKIPCINKPGYKIILGFGGTHWYGWWMP